MNYETILYDKQDGIAVVTLNRPEKRNAVNSKMYSELRDVIDEIESDSSIKVMILTGGEKAFCAGADLSEVGTSKTGRPERVGPSPQEKIRDMTKPTIAAISGACVAGGLELALVCDILLASETAKIGDGHIKMGLLGAAGSPTRIPQLIGKSKAMELILTGDLMSGKEAFQAGLVNHVYPENSLIPEAIALAKRIAKNSPTALKVTKRAVDAGCNMAEFESLHLTSRLLHELLTSDEFRKKVNTFLKNEE